MAQLQVAGTCLSSVQLAPLRNTCSHARALRDSLVLDQLALSHACSSTAVPISTLFQQSWSFQPEVAPKRSGRRSQVRCLRNHNASSQDQRMRPLQPSLLPKHQPLKCGIASFLSPVKAETSVRARAMTTGAPTDVQVSPPWRPALQDIVIEPTEKHTATVIFLHGLGDSGRGWADIVPAFGLKHVKWILPTAETRPITINGGFPMNGWFDVLGLGPSTKEDMKGLDRAAAHVISLIAKERAKAGSDSPIRYAVGGFSQGGSLALHTTTCLTYGRFLDGKPAPVIPLAAAACISGWLSGSDVLAKGRQSLDAAALERASRLPLLQCHGMADPVVNFQFGKLTSEALKGVLGFSKLKFNAYNGVGHQVSPQEVADIKAWLLEQLPPA